MKALFALFIALAALFSSGCATQVHQDYPKYLANNEKRVTYPHVGRPAQYHLDQATTNHRVKIKSWMAGIANSWTVQFGEMLDATMQGRDMQESFESLSKTYSSNDTAELMLSFHLFNYRFENFNASIDMTIAAQSYGHQFLSKEYFAQGRSQGGKMFWGGAFAMKNAVQQSTKIALDKILTNFLNDLNQALSASSSQSASGAVSFSQPLIPGGGARWRGAGLADACGKAWEMDLQIAGDMLAGTIWRDGIEYDIRGKLDRNGEISAARAAKKTRFSHIPGPRFLAVYLKFQGDQAHGHYGINAYNNLECVSQINLIRL